MSLEQISVERNKLREQLAAIPKPLPYVNPMTI